MSPLLPGLTDSSVVVVEYRIVILVLEDHSLNPVGCAYIPHKFIPFLAVHGMMDTT